MRIAFVLGGRVFFRFVDGVVRQLDAAGHRVDVLTPNGTNMALDRCRDECQRVRVVPFGEEPYVWKRPMTSLRHLRAYRHWLEPERRWSDFLRRRWATTAFGFPRWLRGIVKVLGLPRFDRWLGRLPLSVLEALERWIPANPRVVRALAALGPDLVVCTPFVYPSPRRHTTEVEYLKAARQRGIPAAVVVASWDNLSMKGAFYIEPDFVLVWNEIQRREAQDLHDIPIEKVVAAGAPVFDSWFDRRLEVPREEFLREAGLGGQEYVLYVESSAASGDEWTTVHRLAEALDAVDRTGASSNLRVMVRRHPSRKDQWSPLKHPRLKLFPARSAVPDTEEARRQLFNSIHHARSVIGLNTTVFLEAAILDRHSIVLVDPQRDHFQGGLVHFHYLLDAGFLDVAPEIHEAARRILESGRGVDRGKAARRAFVDSFIRPGLGGLSAAQVAATALVDLIEGPAQALRTTR